MVDINNYPFCTIEPNVGIVEVPDTRLQKLSDMSHTKKIVPAVVEFVDIAGLVKGASQGEGLGNKFLANIREVDAIVQVVRLFENPNIIHVHNNVDGAHDIEIVNTELILADMETVAKRKVRSIKEVRAGNKEAIAQFAVLEALENGLEKGMLANSIAINHEDELTKKLMIELSLLTAKPFLYVYNMSDLEATLPTHLEEKPYVRLDIKIEEELMDMTEEDKQEMELVSHIHDLIRKAYSLLGLMTFFTTGEQETRAWTIKQGSTAPQAGAVIHTDFEAKFIRADVIYWQDLLDAGSWGKAKETGKLRLEGKEYIVKDGDVMIFKV